MKIENSKIQHLLHELHTAAREHNIRARGPFVDLPSGRALEHGHRMASIAYQNAWRLVKEAIEEEITDAELRAMLDIERNSVY